MIDIIIIGAGPAGLTSAIYAARAKKTVKVFEAVTYGGKIINALDIKNYPGFEEISGYDFAAKLYSQATNLGAEIAFEKVIDIKDLGDTKKVITEDNEYECRAVIIATGMQNKKLKLENEDKFLGRGVSYCATCDGAFFKEKVVSVYGNGKTAIEDAVFLTDLSSKLYLINQGDKFLDEVDEELLNKLKSNDKVEFLYNTKITSLNGENSLESITVSCNDENKDLQVSGLFVALGSVPENSNFSKYVELDNLGYIISDEVGHTKTPGIYVAGDTRSKEFRQLTTATSDGTNAVLTAIKEMK